MNADLTVQVSNRKNQWYWVALFAVLLSACGTPEPSGKKAPIEEFETADRKPAKVVTPVAPKKIHVPTTSNMTYIVHKGDTLYSIAFLHGVDYREVAEMNNLKDPAAIKIGQQLRLYLPPTEPVAKAEVAAKAEPKTVVVQQPVQLGGIKNQPKVGRLIYSEQALAQADHMQEDGYRAASAVAEEQAQPSQTSLPSPATAATARDDDETIEWGMPTKGKMIAGFSESENRKGVDISGKRGQNIVASASGKVVYSGNGLRGYGKLIIIKHNKTFLSAYAHNDQILVKEGQTVNKGQKIAEMGNSDASQVKLHFEIRYLGKPVDPAKYLPLVKS